MLTQRALSLNHDLNAFLLMFIKLGGIVVGGLVCAQLLRQCGAGLGVHAELVQSVLHPHLSSCTSQCLLPAACAAPVPVAPAC